MSSVELHVICVVAGLGKNKKYSLGQISVTDSQYSINIVFDGSTQWLSKDFLKGSV